MGKEVFSFPPSVLLSFLFKKEEKEGMKRGFLIPFVLFFVLERKGGGRGEGDLLTFIFLLFLEENEK